MPRNRCFVKVKIALFLLIIALVVGYPIIKTYYELGLVPRFSYRDPRYWAGATRVPELYLRINFDSVANGWGGGVTACSSTCCIKRGVSE